jgi:hypothetical protein
MTQYNEETLYNLLAVGDEALLDRTGAKIDQFLELHAGWHFGEGVPPKKELVEKAKVFNSHGKRLGLRTDAFPGIDGGIIITFYALDHCVELRLNGDGSIDLSHEVGIGFEFDEIEYLENANVQQILAELKKLAEFRQCSSESSRKISTIRPLEGSEAHVSLHRAAMTEFQLSTWTAFQTHTSPRYAITYEDSIQIKQ